MESGALPAAFRRWREERQTLRRFGHLRDLISACRKGALPHSVDLALQGLCAVACRGDQQAGTLLVWLLLPGLLSARSGLRARHALPAEDIDAELIAGLWEAAACIDRTHRGVARRLVNAARWRALRAMRDAIAWSEETAELEVEPSATVAFEWDLDPVDPLDVAVRDGVLSEEDEQVLTANRATIRALAERLGLSLNGVQTRRHRARERLREWMKASHQPPMNLPPRPSREPPAKTD